RKMKNHKEILEKGCTCIACKEKITWKYLAELFLQKNPKGFFYATAHNVQFFANLMREIRFAIEKNKFSELKRKYLYYY
ncbi:hypothetical protein HY041_02565, partial [Candidatus Roizmanbacteria bacterium]|nr:hypothetical protein [Candidatus Roizmanbacteria bacterium]